MTKNISVIKKTSYIICLIAIAVGWRVINHNYNFAPNLELVTVVSVLAAITIGMRAALVVPIASMIVSDVIIGNTSIFIFTWSAFALIGLATNLMRKLNNQPTKQIICSIGFAAASSFTFFVITNFGVWVQGWYPMTLAGLTDCFTLAIPFYRTMLIGNLILVPSAVAAYQFVRSRQTAKNSVVDTLVRN